jgi:UDP-glucose 4-epimerase
VASVLEAARNVTGRTIPVFRGPRRAGDPAVLLADASRAKRDLGFSPEFPRIEDMLHSAWRWSMRDSEPLSGAA